ncbi:MAG TPA: hypothetical protein VK116_01560, partial [Planctomycetota bacterium]|nr:hypothetical protein [Planctomycetota bacterium]
SCSKETESATSGNGAAVSVPPGKIRCTLCRGSGRAGSDYRACSKCLGGGVLSCDTCSGSGTVRCIAEVYDRDCPTCRRTGKVECSKCRGTRQIERPEPEASSATVETESASGNNDSKRSEPGVDELEARFIELRALDEACEMWAKGSARSEIERVEDELRVTLQRLDRKKRGEELELLHRELSDIRQRILRLETEWSAIADVLEDFRREFDRCEEYWAKGLEISSSSRSDTSAIARGRWEKDMALVLRLAQGKARRVAGRSPEDYEANVGAIAARVEEIRSQVDEILARPSEESAAEEEEAASLASNDAEREPSEPSDAIDANEGKTDPSGLAKTAEPDAPSSRTGMLLILGVVLATAFGIAFRRTMRKRIERAASHGSFS